MGVGKLAWVHAQFHTDDEVLDSYEALSSEINVEIIKGKPTNDDACSFIHIFLHIVLKKTILVKKTTTT